MRPGKWISTAMVFVVITLAAGIAWGEVSTTRDDKGVWFITGDDSVDIYDVFEAMGYAVATDRLWQAENYRRAARGRLAEIFGQGYLGQDMLVRITGYSETELEDGFNSLGDDAQDMVNGYVAGFNRRIQEVTANPMQLPFEFHALAQQLNMDSFVPEPWTAADVMAWQATMLRNFDPEATKSGQIDNAALLQYLASVNGPLYGMMMFNDLRWTNDPDATTYIPPAQQSAYQAVVETKDVQQYAPVHGAGAGLSGIGDLAEVARKIDLLWNEREEKLREINAFVQMGSYAWVIAGDKTASGNPIIYSGPQMGFDTPAITTEGSINAAGMHVSGMAVPGLPGIVIGRTPHHAWSMQVGHARTVDYYFEPAPADAPGYYTTRTETINVAGGDPVTITVARTPNGPVVNPVPFDPENYTPQANDPIVSWKYAHWGKEFQTISALLEMTRAQDMDAFGAALEDVAVSQHFGYIDRDGNIAYWMSGVDPIRPGNVDWRVPQGMLEAPASWSADNRRPLSTDSNTEQGFYAGWNNKTSPDYQNSFNNLSYMFGPFQRAHVLEEYLLANDNLTFEQVRDLALYIATTDSFGAGGNPWAFVEEDFRAAVLADPTADRTAALEIMDGFDGHFVAGGEPNWVAGMDRSDGWMLSNAWILEVLRLTFLDELSGAETEYDAEKGAFKNPTVLFNVFLRTLDGKSGYDWFQNQLDVDAPQTAGEIIVAALDNVLGSQLTLQERPWGEDARGEIEFKHPFLGTVHTMPFSSRSTFAHVVEMSETGQERIESMFALGQSGTILIDAAGQPEFDPNFASMTTVFDDFSHREFPVFEPVDDPDDSRSRSSSTCFVRTLLLGK
jgi:penicillin G amidase